MAVLEVSGLTYTYPGSLAPALTGVSFEVEAGQMIAIVGANRAGKSTLLLALAGLIPALFNGDMSGSVRAAGLDTRHHRPGDLAGKVGLVLQNPANQLSGMRYTVYEETAFGLENLGTARSEMPERIDRALERVGLSGMKERSPYSLSGGEQQRLALASILALEPGILLLDEATAMLDPRGARAIFDVLHELARNGTTVVAAGHDLEWFAREADRVLALARGRILLDGSPQSVLSSAMLEAEGVGRPRCTRAADFGQKKGLWPQNRPLPATLEEATDGFLQTRRERAGKAGNDADRG